MITEEAAQEFHTDDVLPLRSASDWMKQIFNQSEALPYLGNNMSFCGETSEWQHVHQMSAILSGYASFTGQVKPELHPGWSSSSWFNSNFFDKHPHLLHMWIPPPPNTTFTGNVDQAVLVYILPKCQSSQIEKQSQKFCLDNSNIQLLCGSHLKWPQPRN